VPTQDFGIGAKPQKGFDMIESKIAADGRNVGGDPAPAQLAGMLNVGDVAKMLRCSARTVYRLSDAGRMPRPAKLGALVRWSRAGIEEWIADGCPSCRTGVRR